jgi:hypothetical protein
MQKEAAKAHEAARLQDEARARAAAGGNAKAKAQHSVGGAPPPSRSDDTALEQFLSLIHQPVPDSSQSGRGGGGGGGVGVSAPGRGSRGGGRPGAAARGRGRGAAGGRSRDVPLPAPPVTLPAPPPIVASALHDLPSLPKVASAPPPGMGVVAPHSPASSVVSGPYDAPYPPTSGGVYPPASAGVYPPSSGGVYQSSSDGGAPGPYDAPSALPPMLPPMQSGVMTSSAPPRLPNMHDPLDQFHHLLHGVRVCLFTCLFVCLRGAPRSVCLSTGVSGSWHSGGGGGGGGGLFVPTPKKCVLGCQWVCSPNIVPFGVPFGVLTRLTLLFVCAFTLHSRHSRQPRQCLCRVPWDRRLWVVLLGAHMATRYNQATFCLTPRCAHKPHHSIKTTPTSTTPTSTRATPSITLPPSLPTLHISSDRHALGTRFYTAHCVLTFAHVRGGATRFHTAHCVLTFAHVRGGATRFHTAHCVLTFAHVRGGATGAGVPA